jgi:hypothetical protein
MRPAPPKLVEAIVAVLLPPACREPVLGGLYERCTSPLQYVADALCVVPLVILSQVRRRTDPQVLLMEAFALYLSFLMAAWRLGGVPFLYESSGFLRLAIPTALALVALRLRDVYANPAGTLPRKAILDAACAVAAAYLSQAILAGVRPEFALPGWIMFSGSVVGLLLLAYLRALWPPLGSRPRTATPGGNTAMSLEEIRKKSRKLAKTVRLGNVSLLGGVAVIVFLGWIVNRKDLIAHTPAGWIVATIVIAVSLYVLYQLYRKGPSAPVPASATYETSIEIYRAQLERQRKELNSIWAWYGCPLLAALLAVGLCVPITREAPWRNALPFTILSIAWSIALGFRARQEARNLQREIDSLSTWDKRSK